MKDYLQNISDLIGALAEDIEEIKKILGAKDASDKDEAVKRLAVKLEPVIRFFGGSTPENINGIFRSKETIEAYKKSLGGEMIVSLQEYTDANDKNMRERGIPTTKDLLYKILEILTDHVDTKGTAKARLHTETLPGYPLLQSNKRNQAAMGQNTRWLVQEPLRMGWHRLYARVLCPVCH